MSIPQTAIDIARSLYKPHPLTQWTRATSQGMVAPGLRERALQQTFSDVSGFAGGVSAVRPGLGYIQGLGNVGIRKTLDKLAFNQLDLARDILKNKQSSPQALRYAIGIIDDLSDISVPRKAIDKFKGNPRKLADWIAKHIQEID